MKEMIFTPVHFAHIKGYSFGVQRLLIISDWCTDVRGINIYSVRLHAFLLFSQMTAYGFSKHLFRHTTRASAEVSIQARSALKSLWPA